MLIALGWVVVGFLAVTVLASVARVVKSAILALAVDALPYLLALAWVVLVVALFAQAWILAVAAGLLVLYHLAIVLPRLWRTKPPSWIRDAEHLDLIVANVYIDNETPEAMAKALANADADVIVIAEWNPRFREEFERADSTNAYLHVVCDPDDHTDYAACTLSRIDLVDGSEVVEVGPLSVTKAVVPVGSRSLTVIGMNPHATVDPGGYEKWREQMRALIEYVPTIDGPLVLAGDFNTTRYRVEYKQLLATGLVDAHDSLGKGLSTSFKLRPKGPLAAAGAVVRLDHVLMNDEVRAVETVDLESEGSDHVPFKVRLAIKPVGGQHGR